MGIYDYKNLGTTESKALVSDAMAIMLYSYHNLDNGFAAGYQHNGFGTGLPATLVTALLGAPIPKGDSRRAVESRLGETGPGGGTKAGWTPSAPSNWATPARWMAAGRFSVKRPATPPRR